MRDNRNAVLGATLLLACLLAALTGCGDPRPLAKAQDAVRTGAQKEWLANYAAYINTAPETEVPTDMKRAWLTEHPDGTALPDQAAWEADYRKALDILDRLLFEERPELQRANFLGTAQVLKTVCLWKLGKHAREFDQHTAAIDRSKLSGEQAALLDTIRGLVSLSGEERDLADVPAGTTEAVDHLRGLENRLFEGDRAVMKTFDAALVQCRNPALDLFIMEGGFGLYNLYCRAAAKVPANEDPYAADVYGRLQRAWRRYTAEVRGLGELSEPGKRLRIGYTRHRTLADCAACMTDQPTQ